MSDMDATISEKNDFVEGSAGFSKTGNIQGYMWARTCTHQHHNLPKSVVLLQSVEPRHKYNIRHEMHAQPHQALQSAHAFAK